MIQRPAPCRHKEIAGKQYIALVPYKLHTISEVGINIRFNQAFDAGIFEVDRRRHIATTIKAECTAKILVAALITLYDKILRKRPFMALLRQRKVVLWQEILIERHVVIDILKPCNRRNRYIVSKPAHRQSVDNRRSTIKASVIIVYLTGFIRCIGIAALTGHRGPRAVFQHKRLRRTPRSLHFAKPLTLCVNLLAVIQIAEESIGSIVGADNGQTELLCWTQINRSIRTPRITHAILYQTSYSGIFQRRQRRHIYHATHSVAAVKYALRAPYHLDMVEVGNIEVVSVLVEQRHIVDIHRHDRLVDTSAQTSDIYRRGHTRAIARHIKIGRYFANILQLIDVVAVNRTET